MTTSRKVVASGSLRSDPRLLTTSPYPGVRVSTLAHPERAILQPPDQRASQGEDPPSYQVALQAPPNTNLPTSQPLNLNIDNLFIKVNKALSHPCFELSRH